MLDKFIMLVCATSAILLFGIMLTSCDDQSSFTETHNAEGYDFPIKVHTFEDDIALNKHVKTLEGAPVYAVDGLAQIRVDALGNVKRCDVYVVKPRSATDYTQQENWGHELMHCVYGLYHEEGQR